MRSAMLWGTAVLLLSAGTVLANGGTPLMFVGCFHLVVGNAAIGLLEGGLLGWWFKTPPRSLWIMVVANYVSMIGGLLLLLPTLQHVFPWQSDVMNIRPYLLAAMGLAFLMTVLIEWPACLLALPRGRRGAWRGLKASLAVQTVSYALLVLAYYSISSTGLAFQVQPNQGLLAEMPADLQVYYLGLDGDLWRVSLDGRERQKVQPMGVDVLRTNARLFARGAERGRFDLWMVSRPGREEEETLIVPDFAARAGLPPCDVAWQSRPLRDGLPARQKEPDTWLNFGAPAEFLPAEDWAKASPSSTPTTASAPVPAACLNDGWGFRTGFWAWEGLSATNSRTGQHVRLGLDTPLAHWYLRNATQLPGGRVVLQADTQILVLDLSTRRIALLAYGHGPVVAAASSK